MVEFNLNGETYICEEEDSLEKELRKEGLSPNRINESIDLEITKIVVNGLLWSVNGYVLGKIFDRVPSLFKKVKK